MNERHDEVPCASMEMAKNLKVWRDKCVRAMEQLELFRKQLGISFKNQTWISHVPRYSPKRKDILRTSRSCVTILTEILGFFFVCLFTCPLLERPNSI